MKKAPRWFRVMMSILDWIAPPIGARLGWRIFWQLGEPAAVRESEKAVHERASVLTMTFNDNDVTTYSWGSGDEAVLLVHGWRSRASRFAAVVEALERRGTRVISFDAPGNGDSPGARTNLFEYAAIIAELSKREGKFEAIVAHSIGAVPAFMALRRGTRAARIVTVAGVHDFDFTVSTFAAAVGLPRRATIGLRRRLEKWAQKHSRDVWRYLVSELDATNTPTPLLVVHDSEDREVGLDQAMQIAEAHTGIVETLITEGLGHNRILADPKVIARIASFAVPGAKDQVAIGSHSAGQQRG